MLFRSRQGKDRYNSEMKILKLPGVLVQKREKKIKNGYNNETRERLTTNNDEIKERRYPTRLPAERRHPCPLASPYRIRLSNKTLDPFERERERETIEQGSLSLREERKWRERRKGSLVLGLISKQAAHLV